MPILHDRVSSSTYKFILDKMDARLANWKINMLSMAGRHTLVSSVTSSMPSYAMQTTPLPLGTCKEIDKRSRNFLWGSNANHRKSHLVAWERVCLKKDVGGLGLRQARHQNQAFMTKLGWSLIHKRDSLWVKFMREKYKAGNDIIPKVEKRRSESSTWRGIRTMWQPVLNSVSWRIANGKNILFWQDHWLPNLEKLETLALQPLQDDVLQWKISDCLDEGGHWVWRRFEHLLPSHVLLAMQRVEVHDSRSADWPVWRWSSDGGFTLKSAYYYLTREIHSDGKGPWKLIWKLQVPQRYRLFLWLCIHGRLLTNLHRFHRGFHHSGLCDYCMNGHESILHVLRDCTLIKDFWKTQVPREKHDSFFGIMDRNEWVVWCLNQRFLVSGFEFRLWFAVLCRHIWLARNDRIFNRRSWQTGELLARTKRCLSWRKPNLVSSTGFIMHGDKWRPPMPGSVKINVDGSRRDSGLCTCGGVLRDDTGRVLMCFMYRVGPGSIITAEAWGVLWGLKLAADQGLKDLVVECDCSELVYLLQNPISSSHPDFRILTEIEAMMQRDWSVELLQCRREVNIVADALATEAWEMAVDLLVLMELPVRIRCLALKDYENVVDVDGSNT